MEHLPKDLKDLSVIRENQRFTTFAATYKNKKVFVKLAFGDTFAKKIRSEIWGMEAFYQISQLVDLPFDVPNVVMCGDMYLVSSWAPGERIILTPQNVNKYNKIFVNSLAAIDRATRLANPVTTDWTKPSKTDKSTISKLFERLGKVDYLPYFDESLIETTKKFVHKNAGNLEARLAHTDFTPDNLLQTDTGNLTLVDFEAVTMSWPRFYDVINLAFNRIILEPELAPGMHSLLSEYFNAIKTPVQNQQKQLNVIAMVRALSLIVECLTELDRHHNTAYQMDADIAERLQIAMEAVAKNQLFTKF